MLNTTDYISTTSNSILTKLLDLAQDLSNNLERNRSKIHEIRNQTLPEHGSKLIPFSSNDTQKPEENDSPKEILIDDNTSLIPKAPTSDRQAESINLLEHSQPKNEEEQKEPFDSEEVLLLESAYLESKLDLDLAMQTIHLLRGKIRSLKDENVKSNSNLYQELIDYKAKAQVKTIKRIIYSFFAQTGQ